MEIAVNSKKIQNILILIIFTVMITVAVLIGCSDSVYANPYDKNATLDGGWATRLLF